VKRRKLCKIDVGHGQEDLAHEEARITVTCMFT
jgi:hypothetical protein